jgi:hypothetical protein
MSISREWVDDPYNQKTVLAMYRSSEMLTTKQIAEKMDTRPQNVLCILKESMPSEERKALMRIRYSIARSGKNYGMVGENHHNWKGDCKDQKGYLTRIYNGERKFVHHLVMMEHLGIEKIPEGM